MFKKITAEVEIDTDYGGISFVINSPDGSKSIEISACQDNVFQVEFFEENDGAIERVYLNDEEEIEFLEDF